MEEAAAAWSSDDRISFQNPAPAPATHDNCSDADQAFKEAVQAFHTDYFDIMESKMHKIPPSLIGVPTWYIKPVTVAIGPYHHGFLFGDLCVPPLFRTEANATWLVNMAAFELCKTPDFEDDDVRDEDSTVCSYLHLFAMLLDQKEHVHDLRKRKVIEGGGLTSKAMLELFTGIGKNIRLGQCYLDIIIEIQNLKGRMSIWLRSYLFLIKYFPKIKVVVTIIGAFVGILSSLQALKPH